MPSCSRTSGSGGVAVARRSPRSHRPARMASSAAGLEVRARRSAGSRRGRRRRRAAAPSASGASTTGEAPAEVEVARVGAHGLDGQVARAPRSASSSTGSRSSPTTGTPRAARSSATRPVPQPRSSTGPAAGELAPEREVLGVAAALEVVPDHVELGHANDPFAAPRCDELLAQREHRRVGRQRIQRPVAVADGGVERRRQLVAHDDALGAARPRTSSAPPSRPRACRCR